MYLKWRDILLNIKVILKLDLPNTVLKTSARKM